MSNANFAGQGQDVYDILEQLGTTKSSKPIVEVFNKIDCLGADELNNYKNLFENSSTQVLTSALNCEGVERLCSIISDLIGKFNVKVCLTIPQEHPAAIAWIKSKSQIIEQKYKPRNVILKIDISPHYLNKFKVEFANKSIKIARI